MGGGVVRRGVFVWFVCTSKKIIAGVDADARQRSKGGADAIVLELSSAFFTQVANGGKLDGGRVAQQALSWNAHRLRAGLAARLAEEICWQIVDEPNHRYSLIRSGARVPLS